jgi:Zn-dependent M16 (insulinase) family peptidase
MIGRVFLILFLLFFLHDRSLASPHDLVDLKKNQAIGDLRVVNLYADSGQQIVGAKLWHSPTGAPIYIFQVETVPQVFMWVDTPADSNEGLAHALEHVLGGKGTTGRYVNLLRDMRLSRSAAATTDDYNMYSFSCGTGLRGFFEQFRAWLAALYKPDFSDLEAEREFYHFGVSFDADTRKDRLIEEGSVYNEMQSGQGIYRYYFELNKRLFGDLNPFGFYSGGIPDDMRHVTPQDIRQFHAAHYRLGPTTGFIFVLSSREDIGVFLEHVSQELRVVALETPAPQVTRPPSEPKYPIQPSATKEITIYPFPSNSEADRGEVRFGWKPNRADAQTDVKLLQLFFRALGDGDKSMLYRSLIDSRTREFDSGAINVESLVFLGNSPFFPAEFIGFSGIAGNRLTVDRVEQLRSRLLATITQISQYADDSQDLVVFDQLVASYAKALRRSERVWSKSAPRFGFNYETEWKDQLEYLEMDPSFVRSISDEPEWEKVEQKLRSGKNVWRDLIQRFHLLDLPYATASIPSPKMLDEVERNRQKRIAMKTEQLMSEFATEDEQQALIRFEQEEIVKTREIDKIAARVVRPEFAEHPPLTLDDDIQYRQSRIEGVPVIAAVFDRAPTIDITMSFDLHGIPKKYYKYLPILPRCIDLLGLKTNEEIAPFDDLQAHEQAAANDFSIGYDSNPVSHRADLNIQASATTLVEFRRTLALIQRMMNLSHLEFSRTYRLRDIVSKRLWQEDAFSKGEDDYWFMNAATAFRYQDDQLYVALSSQLTRAHWDNRLLWLLHEPVPSEKITALGDFANHYLNGISGISAKELSQRLSRSNVEGLEGELIEYWERNVPSFSDDRLLPGLRRLTFEVQEDLRTGPKKTISDLNDLRRMVLSRDALSIVITLDPAALNEVRQLLASFLQSFRPSDRTVATSPRTPSSRSTVMDNVLKRYHLASQDFPWFVALEDSSSGTANLVFIADHPGYSDIDRRSLLRVLSTKLVSGSGPHTFYTKTEEDGLAYGSSITSEPSLKMIRYYAARTPDISALIDLVNSVAGRIPELADPSLIDYALQKVFPLPRSMSTFADRGRGIANDIRDGNDPATVRRFYRAMLSLRTEPNLLSAITEASLPSIRPVLVDKRFAKQQRQARSLFFFVGPERLLTDAETRLQLKKMLRLYPSDFWIDFPDDSSRRKDGKSIPHGAQ